MTREESGVPLEDCRCPELMTQPYHPDWNSELTLCISFADHAGSPSTLELHAVTQSMICVSAEFLEIGEFAENFCFHVLYPVIDTA